MGETSTWQEVYDSLTAEFTRIVIVRAIIMLTVIITLYNATLSLNEGAIERKMEMVVKLKEQSGWIPYIDDYIIDNLNSHASVNNRGTGLTAADSIAENQQRVILSEIKAEYRKAFQLQIPTFADANLDLRYWIFFLPILFMASSVYIFILSLKIRLIERKAWRRGEMPAGEAILNKNNITSFNRYPFQFIKVFFLFVENIFLVIYFITIFSFLQNFLGETIQQLVISYGIVTYFFFGYAFYIKQNISREMLEDEYKEDLVIRAWNGLVRFVAKALHKVGRGFSVMVGSAGIFLSLFLVMSLKSCYGPDQIKSNYQIRGYQFLTDPVHKTWNWGEGSLPLDVVMQILYVLVLLLAVQALISYYRKNIPFLSFRLVCGIYLLFTVYFSFFLFGEFDKKVGQYLGISSLFVIVMWYLASREHANPDGYTRGWLLKVTFFFCLPFCPLTVLTLGFLSLDLTGWPVFYLALFFLFISYSRSWESG